MRPRLPTKSQLDDAAEADPDDVFGQIAFAYDRSDDVPLEKNTKREDEIESHIANHFAASGKKRFTQGDVNLILGFLRDKKYTKIFKRPPPNITELYRGMGVTEAWLKKALNLGARERIGEHGFKAGSFTFIPRSNSPATSWTSNDHLAYQFGHGSQAEGWQYGVVLTAQVEGNEFISGPDGLYKLNFIDEYKNENECVGFGKIKVTEIRWE